LWWKKPEKVKGETGAHWNSGENGSKKEKEKEREREAMIQH
jgi:hypothetical protein